MSDTPIQRIRHRLKPVIEETTTQAGRYFDISIQILIVLSILSFTISTLPDLSPMVQRGLDLFRIISVSVFTLEYLLRIWVADQPLRFMFSLFGLIDLLAILPFYLATAIDLRSLRILRLLRLFRIIKIFRYNNALKRFKDAFMNIRAELTIFFATTMFTLYIAAVGIYYFEHTAQPEEFSSMFDALWWAVATLTTVGYGDIYPITTGGRFFTFVVLMIGLGIVAVPSGLLADALKEARKIEQSDPMETFSNSRPEEYNPGV
ncbi:MAG: ion transporter [Bacteroidota bacterium]